MTRDEAIAVARRVADEEGWPWDTPVAAVVRRRFLLFGARTWEVMTNAASRGANVRIVVDDRTGEVCARHFLPR